jgi:F0F1-type ATP synthase membrane subunit b/b'
MPERSLARLAAVTACTFFLALPMAACDREDQAKVEEELEQVEENVDEALEDAEPVIEEGVREAGKAVGKGVEAAGELIQKGGEELQEEVRDTSASTLPDTVTKDR